MKLINFLKEAFGITTEIVRASTLPDYKKTGNPSGDLVELCKATQANTYISGSGGRNYLDTQKFSQEGIELVFQDFHHPTYTQRYQGFLPDMASIDCLFNTGTFISIND